MADRSREMDHVHIMPTAGLGSGFIPTEYLPEGEDEYYLRDLQQTRSAHEWRNLTSDELDRLVKNGNYSPNWDDVLVTDQFDPALVRNSEFFGRVRIGMLENVVLEHHDLRISAGVTHSKIIACDIGDHCAVHNVRYLAHYILGNRVLCVNIDEMHTTDYAKFGNGLIKEGEPEDVRIWLDLVNESGGRRILPFEDMIPADAYLWAKFRENEEFQKALLRMTQSAYDSRRGYYGTVGDESVIKNTRIIKDVRIGSHCYIKGANKLKNLTIKSTPEEPTQIGEGVELVNGIIGLGSRIFYGCKAVRFVTGSNTQLKYGARLLNSLLGDNSTVSCCEILNNLIFPGHEQHHNNSFLIASCVLGQSNIAAGATIGSNHNSRANDNEILAGRGFWPGLCTSLKHSSRFASYTMIAKGDFPAELDIRLPFSLVNNNVSRDRLEVMPAYWWLYDLYALARNSWKYGVRDKRKTKLQHIEFDYLAPDTVEEIIRGMELLEEWTGMALIRRDLARPGSKRAAADTPGDTARTADRSVLRRRGRNYLLASPKEITGTEDIEILGEGMERSKRQTLILKAREGYRAYRDMLLFYCLTNLLDHIEDSPKSDPASVVDELSGDCTREWINLGGQLVPGPEVDRIVSDIASGALGSWEKIHQRYDELWEVYPREKRRHARRVYMDITTADLMLLLDEGLRIVDYISRGVYESRKKDFDNPFRRSTFQSDAEMEAVVGSVEDNPYIRQVEEQSASLRSRIRRIRDRLGRDVAT